MFIKNFFIFINYFGLKNNLYLASSDIYKSILNDNSIMYYTPYIEYTNRKKKFSKIITKSINKNVYPPRDIFGIRIIYDTNLIDDDFISYKILYNINRNFNCTIEFDDYIRNKKENDYQSLHQNIYYNDLPIEIQIRNKEMDYVANYGKAKK